jgi:hypothetical protein
MRKVDGKNRCATVCGQPAFEGDHLQSLFYIDLIYMRENNKVLQLK